MKRVGHLIEPIAQTDNLHEAYLRAARGKRGKREVQTFAAGLGDNLWRIAGQLLDGSYRFGPYRFFTVYDPKRREICAAPFADRVVFHAMMRVCHRLFDDYQTADSYASRLGRGTYAALERARTLSRRHEWFAKLDVRRYFDSIDHGVLLSQLCRLVKDPTLLLLWRRLLDGYEVSPGRGLPIGNLTSQYFANHYLAPADHYVRERLRAGGVVRYMDDVLLFDRDRDRLMDVVRHYTAWVGDTLNLDLHEPVVNRTERGVPFLGYVVRPGGLRLNRRSRSRFVHKMAQWSMWLRQGLVTEHQYATHATCLLAFIDKADSTALKIKLSRTPGMYPQGL